MFGYFSQYRDAGHPGEAYKERFKPSCTVSATLRPPAMKFKSLLLSLLPLVGSGTMQFFRVASWSAKRCVLNSVLSSRRTLRRLREWLRLRRRHRPGAQRHLWNRPPSSIHQHRVHRRIRCAQRGAMDWIGSRRSHDREPSARRMAEWEQNCVFASLRDVSDISALATM